jgi:hypothetical protein
MALSIEEIWAKDHWRFASLNFDAIYGILIHFLVMKESGRITFHIMRFAG